MFVIEEEDLFAPRSFRPDEDKWCRTRFVEADCCEALILFNMLFGDIGFRSCNVFLNNCKHEASDQMDRAEELFAILRSLGCVSGGLCLLSFVRGFAMKVKSLLVYLSMWSCASGCSVLERPAEERLPTLAQTWLRAWACFEDAERSGLPARVTHSILDLDMALVTFADGKRAYVGITEITNAQYEVAFPSHSPVNVPPRAEVGSLSATELVVAEVLKFCAKFDVRLPTPKEWREFASGGVESAFIWGDEVADASGWLVARGSSLWLRWKGVGNGFPFPHRFFYVQPVASCSLPNRWGLFDVLGNVAELCKGLDPGDITIRGGSYRDGPDKFNLDTVDYIGLGVFTSAGFRVLKDVPEFLGDKR